MATFLNSAGSRQTLRAVYRATRPAVLRRPRPVLSTNLRGLATTPVRLQSDRDSDSKATSTTGRPPQTNGTNGHPGAYARTDESIEIEYPKHEDVPKSPIVQGRGGMHFKRTLASFSLENKVSIVTGGARGLGLVMGQALVASGSDLAIVDLNSKWYLVTRTIDVMRGANHAQQSKKPKSRLRSWSRSSRKRILVWSG